MVESPMSVGSTPKTVPDFVRAAWPSATGWVSAGDRRWRAKYPNMGGSIDLFVLLSSVRDSAFGVQQFVDLDGEPDPDEAADCAWRALQDLMDHKELPECLAPGCGEKGISEAVVAELGSLAGRPYSPGDRVRMCVPHAMDAMSAGEGLDRIAEWLRPDAEVREFWHRAEAARYPERGIHQLRARIIRLMHPASIGR